MFETVYTILLKQAIYKQQRSKLDFSKQLSAQMLLLENKIIVSHEIMRHIEKEYNKCAYAA